MARFRAAEFPAASDARALCESRSMVHMRTASSTAKPDRGSGMAHPQAYLAAADGKHPVSKSNSTAKFIVYVRRLLIAAVAFFVASGSFGYAQTGPFAGMAGAWSG